MRSPNPEQLKAIKHDGGMILNAGAGSGKTTVLVAHLIYLIEKFFENNKHVSGEELAKKLSQLFSTMVFMTFTKKAAGELSSRIGEEIFKKTADEKWEIAESQLSHLFIGTIHGFCSKLLSQGYVTEIGPEITMLSDLEFKEKIHSLVRGFYEKEGKNLKIADLLLSNIKSIGEGFEDVFNSLEIRIRWKGWNPSSNLNPSFKSFMEQLGFSETFDRVNLDDFMEHDKKSWYGTIQGFLQIYNNKKFDDIYDLEIYHDFLQGIKRIAGPTAKDSCPLGTEVISKIRELKEFLNDNFDPICAFYKNPEVVLAWAQALKSIFNYIEEQIPYHKGLVYSDLEYYVLKGLKDPKIAKRVRENYSYFVVDEFQDTSSGQSEIIEKLTDKNFQKLFCVGDLKQAIYGFRGGEIGVFLDYLGKMPLKEELNNNYRALKNLIDFNNYFFDHVFNTSLEYDKFQESQIPISRQLKPIDSEAKGEGEIIRLLLQVDGEGRVGKKEQDGIESKGILKLIQKIQKDHPGEEICVLYRNRGPSIPLIITLIGENLEFCAQVDIAEKSDPIMGIFKVAIEAQSLFQSGKDPTPYLEILIKSYLDYLNILIPKNLNALFKQFILDQKVIGLLESTKKFFFSLNISNSNYQNNFSNLESLINLAGEDNELILKYINDNEDLGYTFDFQMGKGGKHIKIMTVHASKGLEFDHVILGGIHTNGTGRGGETPFFGITLGSFKWKLRSKDKRPFKTPLYYLEEGKIKQRDGLESKRLLYVACTRAKKSLSYVDIEGRSYGEKSWINAFRYFENSKNLITTILEKIPLSGIPPEEFPRPLFHRDGQGTILKQGAFEFSYMGTLGDISVTALAPLSECSRKFYLKNICRIDEDEYSKPLIPEADKTSSSKRGSKIHQEISKRILNPDLDPISGKDGVPIKFALDYLSKVKNNYEVISEKPFKFPLFGFMCSGIPDAILIPLKEVPFQIIDFKTGSKKEASHLFQLYAYAYGVYRLGMLDKKKQIKLVVLYLDSKDTLEVLVDYQKTNDEVFKVWKNLYNLNQVNLSHCEECSYKGLCYSSVAST